MIKPIFKDFLPEGFVSNYEVDEEVFLNTGGLESPFANELDEGRMSDIMIEIEEELGSMMRHGITQEEDQLERLRPKYGGLVTLSVIRQIKADKGDLEPVDMFNTEPPEIHESVEVSEIKALTEKLMKR